MQSDNDAKPRRGPKQGQLSLGRRIAALRPPEPKHEAVRALEGLRRPAVVWVYINTRGFGYEDHLRIFVNEEAAKRWLAKSDPNGEAYPYFVNE